MDDDRDARVRNLELRSVEPGLVEDRRGVVREAIGLGRQADRCRDEVPGPADVLPPAPVMASSANVAPREMLRSKVFWLLFVMMTMMSTGGLMVISQFAVFTKDFDLPAQGS